MRTKSLTSFGADILKNFDMAIIRAPKEGLMGLDRNGKEIVLNNGDLINIDLLDPVYAALLYNRGMLSPIKTKDPKELLKYDWKNRGKLKIRRSRKNRHIKNLSLDKWL